jgi:uncharacterized small protein (DUF1192 family)
MRKRSKYRPKGVIRDPMSHVISGMKKVGDLSSGTTLMIMNHDALDRARRGLAERRDLDVLIAAVNMAEALVRMRIGDDWKDEIRAAQDALFAVGSRGVETGKFILRGPELTSLNLGMEIHDAQLEACTVAELERAIDIVHNEIRHHRARPIIKKEENV